MPEPGASASCLSPHQLDSVPGGGGEILTLHVQRHVVTTGTSALTATVVWHSQELSSCPKNFLPLEPACPSPAQWGRGQQGPVPVVAATWPGQRGLEASQRAALGTGCSMES